VNQKIGAGEGNRTLVSFPAQQYRNSPYTGQFWSQTGDEALMCLETFRRNKRWHILFPHSKSDPSKN
jgi:hypothetical protein